MTDVAVCSGVKQDHNGNFYMLEMRNGKVHEYRIAPPCFMELMVQPHNVDMKLKFRFHFTGPDGLVRTL